MARDFWSKRLIPHQLRRGLKCSQIPAMERESTSVLETFWRRPQSHRFCRRSTECILPFTFAFHGSVVAGRGVTPLRQVAELRVDRVTAGDTTTYSTASPGYRTTSFQTTREPHDRLVAELISHVRDALSLRTETITLRRGRDRQRSSPGENVRLGRMIHQRALVDCGNAAGPNCVSACMARDYAHPGTARLRRTTIIRVVLAMADWRACCLTC